MLFRMSKSRLLKYLDEVRTEMRAVLADIDPEREIYPGWGMKENIAHITGWDEVTVKALRAYLDTGRPYLMPDKSYDAHNADMLRVRAEMSFEEILQEWEATRTTLKEALAELSEEDLEFIIPFPWGLQGSIKDMLYIIAEHERDHAGGIEQQS